MSMCISEQSKVFVNDQRPEYYVLAELAISNPGVVTDQMLPLVCTQPGVTDQATDGDILAAVQYLWPTVGERYVSEAPAP
jgi:hypothetical protein